MFFLPQGVTSLSNTSKVKERGWGWRMGASALPVAPKAVGASIYIYLSEVPSHSWTLEDKAIFPKESCLLLS